MGQVGSLLLAVAFPLALFALTERPLRSALSLGRLWIAFLLLVGGALGALSFYGEALFWSLSGLSLVATNQVALASILAMLLFAAPLEEGSKLLAVWSVHQLGRLRKRADAVVAAVAVGAGFAASEGVLYLLQPSPLALAWLRVLLGACAHVFFAGVWGAVLGTRSRLHLLSITWFACMVVHGLFDHVVFGRGEGTLVVSLPLLVMMVVLGWLLMREVRQGEVWVPRPVGLAPPSLRELQAAMRRRQQPLMLRWIIAGTFVTTGVVIASLALAVAAGHEMGIDFSVADEADMRSNGPLMLLGAAVLMAFPVAGYLVARASASRSVLEAAMGAALAITVVVALLSLAAPVAVVFALAVAPVAFGLACLGAWFGVTR